MPVLVYTLLRLVLVAAVWGVLVLAGTGPLLAVALAVVVAALLSYVLLRRPRDAAARWLQARTEARGQRRLVEQRRTAAERDADEEDAAVDGLQPPTRGLS